MVSSGATPELMHLAELMRIPVVMTLMGKGGFPSAHPLNLGAVGMHGARYANHALTQSDLIIAAGARFSDRVTGDVADFAPNAKSDPRASSSGRRVGRLSSQAGAWSARARRRS